MSLEEALKDLEEDEEEKEPKTQHTKTGGPKKLPRVATPKKPSVPPEIIDGTLADQLRWVITTQIKKNTFAYRDIFKAFERVFGEWERSYESLSRTIRQLADRRNPHRAIVRVGPGEYSIKEGVANE